MNPGTTALLVGACLSAGCAAHLLGSYAFTMFGNVRIKRRVQGRLGVANREDAFWETAASLADRILLAILKQGGGRREGKAALGNLLKADAEADRSLLDRAGLHAIRDAYALQHSRLISAATVAVMLFLVGLLTGAFAACLAAALGFFLGYRLPGKLLAGMALRRRDSCERTLPEMLEIIALGTQAGLSFDAALDAYVSQSDGLLAHEMRQVYLGYMQGAQSREAALGQLADELDSGVFRRFACSVIESLLFGAVLCDVLRELGRDIRAEYKAQVSERIAKAPVKMLIPMGTLILPAMLLLVLGPVVINMMSETM